MFPVFYILMSHKTADLYERVFAYIEKNIFKLNPTQFMCDFETGLRAAIRKFYPNTPMHGCWFHYSQRIRSRHMKSNMYRLITEDFYARRIYRKMLRLPLLPAENILEGYESIKADARSNRLSVAFRQIFKYFEEYWLNLVSLPWVTLLFFDMDMSIMFLN